MFIYSFLRDHLGSDEGIIYFKWTTKDNQMFLTPSQAQQTNWNCSGKNIEKIKSNKLIDAKNIKYMIESICTI